MSFIEEYRLSLYAQKGREETRSEGRPPVRRTRIRSFGRVHQKEHRGLPLRHGQAQGLLTKTILRARRLLSLSRAFLRNRYPNTSDAPFVPPRACGAVPCAFRNPYSTDQSIPPDWIRRARCTPASRRWRYSAGIPPTRPYRIDGRAESRNISSPTWKRRRCRGN